MSNNRNTAAVQVVSSVSTQSIILTILFSALGVALPVIFHQLGIAAVRFSPMHFPVLLSALLLGPVSGVIVGISSVLFSMLFTGMPMLFPAGIAMLFELATYGFIAAVVHIKLFAAKKSYVSLLLSLGMAMLAGRFVHAFVQFVLSLFSSTDYTLSQLWNSLFVVSFPGILLQIAILPVLSSVILKSGLLGEKK